MRTRLTVFSALALASMLSSAQTAPATPRLATPQSSAAKPLATEVAGIPVNYDEAKVGAYTLPEALLLNNGEPVKDAKTFTQTRRPEIVELFESQQYGRVPAGVPLHLEARSFEITDKGTPAFDGLALRKQVTIHLTKPGDGSPDKAGLAIHLLEYLPAAAHKPVPLLLNINFTAIQGAVADPGITPQTIWDAKTGARILPQPGFLTESRFTVLNAQALLSAGIGIATFYYGDVEPDFPSGFPHGIRAHYLKPGQTKPAPDEWGAIAAWAWGLSRVEDYLETDPGVDAKRVAIHGISRLGKTVMWAGAHDQRFAAIIASCSGEGGAALSHRNFGETIAHLTAPTRYDYQFAANWAKYDGFPDKAPFDANMLIALVAPRPLLLQTGTTDYWSDPKGEFLAEVAAAPVYKLLGKQDLGTDTWPAAKTPILTNGLSYYMHDGAHGMVSSDWDIYTDFLKRVLHPEK